ncbi:MAG TPA: phenylacetate--CoA ligase [Candidatus Sumerlaeota bacterium]|nr:phenylacetate--CoA ligase [Candidatus Sumerlaeota bacterium]HON49377.1 phenylacetate--CoA ligase [Candidatus Sumerlaeota bacterium]HOR64875.1 phenylacetate--CoA ligase [Candidatus Sumerlaeota bacterium]HPL73028.1 phenylacetate--CoA ligase [Candidatus Sumerlaeota bacterium]HRU52936.1 phenylacetate--CoA ligase [Candidatus Sumerlaeia bacterium]
MIWNPDAETMPVGQRRELQLELLKKQVKYVYERQPAYRAKMEKAGIKPEDIKSLDDLRLLPYLTKADMRENYPYGLFCVPMKEVVRVHSSSGTTGKPTAVGYTKKDIEIWAEVMARALACGGATPDSVIQNAYGYGMFTGGLGIHYGGERMGCAVLPASSGQTKRQLIYLQDFGTTLITCTPSYSLHLAEEGGAEGVDFKKLPLKYGVLGAEPWSEGMREKIEHNLNIKATDIYGLSEIIGPGVANECLEQKGLHIFDDHFLPEVINHETGEPLPPGQRGELVITTLTKEGFPAIRYRTGDITALLDAPCPCGRTHIRMERITGRTDDMLIIRGVNVFPSQIESILMDIEGVEPHYIIYLRRDGALDDMEIHVEVSEKVFSDEVKKLEALAAKIQKEIQGVLALSPRIKLVEPKSLERSMGKAKRVFDERKI